MSRESLLTNRLGGRIAEGKYTVAELRPIADRLPFTTGHDPADLTPAVMADFEAEMRRRLGMEEER